MKRPYIICHMVTSIDGKVTGDFLSRPESEKAVALYYELNRSLRAQGFICGRITMEESFTGGWMPDLSAYAPVTEKCDCPPREKSGFYAVAFDTRGRLGWRSNCIIDPDEDPGYHGAQIIEVLSEAADPRYVGYLAAMEIPYLFAGKTAIDVSVALEKLKVWGIDTLLLEGGSILNGAFQRADCVDELSLVVAPVTAEKEDKPLFTEGKAEAFSLIGTEVRDNAVLFRYKKDETYAD